MAFSCPASLASYHPHPPGNFTSVYTAHLQEDCPECVSLPLAQSWSLMFLDFWVETFSIVLLRKENIISGPMKAMFASLNLLSWLIRQREPPTWHGAPRELLLSVCTHSTLTEILTQHCKMREFGVRKTWALTLLQSLASVYGRTGEGEKEDRYSTLLFVVFFSILKENALWDLIFSYKPKGKHDSRNGFICHSFMSFLFFADKPFLALC